MLYSRTCTQFSTSDILSLTILPRGSGTSLMLIIAMSDISGIVTAGSVVISSTIKFSGTSNSRSVNRLIEMHRTSPWLLLEG